MAKKTYPPYSKPTPAPAPAAATPTPPAAPVAPAAPPEMTTAQVTEIAQMSGEQIQGTPTPGRVGRPPLSEAGVETMHIKVPVPVFDAYSRHAIRTGVTMSEVVREILARNAPRTN